MTSADGIVRYSAISVHKISEVRSFKFNSVFHGHVLEYPINGNAEEGWSQDASLPDTRSRLEAFGQFLPKPNTDTCTCIMMKSKSSCSRMSGTLLLRMAYHKAMQSTESNAGLISRFLRGLLNSQCNSDRSIRARICLDTRDLTKGICPVMVEYPRFN